MLQLVCCRHRLRITDPTCKPEDDNQNTQYDRKKSATDHRNIPFYCKLKASDYVVPITHC